MSKARFRTSTAWLIVVTLAAGLLLSWTLAIGNGQGEENSAPSAGDTQAIEQAKSLSRAFSSAANQVLPTVVKVRTTTKPRQSGLPGSPWYGMPNVPRPGLGSGVIVDSSGLVLTNNHVVKDADEVKVQLGDGRDRRRVGNVHRN